MAHILIIEPNYQIAKTMSDFLLSKGYTVRVAHTASQAIEYADAQRPTVVTTELSLKGHSGLEFLYEFRTYPDWQPIPIIMYTTVRVTEAVRQSRAWQHLGITAYLYKPTATLKQLEQEIANSQFVSLQFST